MNPPSVSTDESKWQEECYVRQLHKIESSKHTKIEPQNHLNRKVWLQFTFAPPKSIVKRLKSTWVIARTKMKICSWCNASIDNNGTFPYNTKTIKHQNCSKKEENRTKRTRSKSSQKNKARQNKARQLLTTASIIRIRNFNNIQGLNLVPAIKRQ